MTDQDEVLPKLSRLGRYEILSELGKGAMGVVYLAKDPSIGRLVAIKTIRKASPGEDDSESREFHERFTREAQTAGILSHPNIVTIYDVGEDHESGVSYIAMEYIEGKTLKTLMADRAHFVPDQVADIIAQVAEALDYAHRKGIVHRDIKPANVILTTDGKVKITDFGIAKIASSNLTTTGQFLGTPNYMSPEQVTGAPIDGRSDIFSLGVVLYEMLAKRKPFSGENLTTISYKIVHESFTPVHDISKDVPEEFDNILSRAMAKDPWNRYQRGKDMALALYQTKARFEERAIFHDLGTLVASAENMPTLKLENISQLVREGAPLFHESRDQSDSRETDAPVESEEAPLSTVALTLPPPETPGPKFGDESPARVPSPASSPGSSGPVAAREPGAISAPIEVRRAEPASGPPPIWKAQVNPKYVWGIVGVFAILAAVLWLIVIKVRQRQTQSSRVVVATEGADLARMQQIQHGKDLYSAGKYADALALFRSVLQRDPTDKIARDYSRMCEEAISAEQTKKAAEEKAAQVNAHLQNAKEAIDQKDYEKAIAEAGAVLDLDPSSADARRISEDARVRLAADKRAELKKKDKKKNGPAPEPLPRVAAETAPPPPAPLPAPIAPNTPATIHLTFNSPISKGYLMVGFNDLIVFRKNFDFGKQKGGAVADVIHVQPGATTVKVWLTTPDSSVKGFQSIPSNFKAGESRTLSLHLDGKSFTASLP